jgi:hypothetical protein
MVLYIGGHPYTRDTSQDVLLQAVKNLPSPIPNVKIDFDRKLYNLRPSGLDFLISMQKGHIPINQITGNNKYIFSKKSKCDEEAYCVHQNFCGFVTCGKMGTTNVQDCVALIVQDKAVNKTALAHISKVSTNKNIQNILSYMPKGKKEAILIGGRYDIGEHNVKKILSVLANYESDVFIKKSYVCDRAYVYDTSGTFMESCYELNTGFGDIVVDASNLDISCGYPTRRFPEHAMLTKENSIEMEAFKILF